MKMIAILWRFTSSSVTVLSPFLRIVKKLMLPCVAPFSGLMQARQGKHTLHSSTVAYRGLKNGLIFPTPRWTSATFSMVASSPSVTFKRSMKEDD